MSIRREITVVLSPEGGETPEEKEANLKYARATVYDSVMRGEAPVAPRLLYSEECGVDLTDKDDIRIAQEAQQTFMDVGQTVVYVDRGIDKKTLRLIYECRNQGNKLSLRGIRRMSTDIILEQLVTSLHRIKPGDVYDRDPYCTVYFEAAVASCPDRVSNYLEEHYVQAQGEKGRNTRKRVVAALIFSQSAHKKRVTEKCFLDLMERYTEEEDEELSADAEAVCLDWDRARGYMQLGPR